MDEARLNLVEHAAQEDEPPRKHLYDDSRHGVVPTRDLRDQEAVRAADEGGRRGVLNSERHIEFSWSTKATTWGFGVVGAAAAAAPVAVAVVKKEVVMSEVNEVSRLLVRVGERELGAWRAGAERTRRWGRPRDGGALV